MCTRVDPYGEAVVGSTQLVHGCARATPDVDKATVLHAEIVERPGHETTLGTEPPVVTFDTGHHVEALVVHLPLVRRPRAQAPAKAEDVDHRPRTVTHGSEPAVLIVRPRNRDLDDVEISDTRA